MTPSRPRSAAEASIDQSEAPWHPVPPFEKCSSQICAHLSATVLRVARITLRSALRCHHPDERETADGHPLIIKMQPTVSRFDARCPRAGSFRLTLGRISPNPARHSAQMSEVKEEARGACDAACLLKGPGGPGKLWRAPVGPLSGPGERNQPPEVSSSASALTPAQSYGSFSQPSGRTTRLLPEVRPRGPSAPSGHGWSRSSSCS